YGDSFDEALQNLDKVLTKCERHQLSLSHEKCLMMMDQGIVLEHHISAQEIQVDPKKVE
ncbi:hypothetical protein KI387_040200, partial [Taxus chinensis]